MDLGLKGRNALVCGSSAGLGRACAEALLAAGCNVTVNGRDAGRVRRAAEEMQAAAGRPVPFIAADVTTPEGRAELVRQCAAPDILVNNAAGPPTGLLQDWDESHWNAAVNANMVAPIMLIKTFLPAMRAQGWGRIVNITSSATKAPLPLLGLSNGARSGLTGFVAGLAREVASEGVTVNNLLPGRFSTGRLQSYIASMAASQGLDQDAAARKMWGANPMQRFGRPEEFGMFCAFLASAHAGYMTGQNILLDGGEYPGL
ncbi:MAG: SDR family oxidoreductase [Comamonadaceae bacterium]|nr:MAG: SDR family oxidoreductase [Comamonadaceae bacterium]